MEPVTARTLPCLVERNNDTTLGDSSNNNTIRFVLSEGRNRQIRKMCAALGLEVTLLHRVAFAGVTLCGCNKPGDWATLEPNEESMICAAPTREEQRTPEERAKRKLKKLAKKNRRLL